MKLRHLIQFAVFLASLLLIINSASAQQDSVFTTFSGDSVTVWNTHILENCASRFAVSITMLGNDSISITETDTIGPIANCICTYDLSVTLTGLGIGHYTVDVYRLYLLEYFYEKDTTVYIGSTTFDIAHLPSMSYSDQFYQSECKERTGVSEKVEVPNNYSLEVNYPNPFNPSTQITFSLPKATYVTLKVYDVLGREISVLVNEKKQPGEYSITWNAEGVPSGVYFYRMVAGGYIETKKMVIIQ